MTSTGAANLTGWITTTCLTTWPLLPVHVMNPFTYALSAAVVRVNVTLYVDDAPGAIVNDVVDGTTERPARPE